MPFLQFSCPHCQGILEIDSMLAGRQVGCPTCAGVVTIPFLEQPAAPPMPAAPPEPAPVIWQPPSFGPPPETPQYQPFAPPPDAGVQLACPLCNGVFEITAEMQGQEVSCPHCTGNVSIPVFDAAPADAANYGPPGLEAPPPNAPPELPQDFPGIRTRKSRKKFESPVFDVSPPTENMYPPGFGPAQPHSTAPAFDPPAMNVPMGVAVNPAPPSMPMMPPSVATQPFVPQGGVDSMLPPGASNVPLPLAPVPAPMLPPSVPMFAPTVTPEPPRRSTTKASIVITNEDGESVALHEPVKTVGKGPNAIELRTLTPEEKARRRLKKNIVMLVFSMAVLVIAFFVLRR